jgi:hypothetical protein
MRLLLKTAAIALSLMVVMIALTLILHEYFGLILLIVTTVVAAAAFPILGLGLADRVSKGPKRKFR